MEFVFVVPREGLFPDCYPQGYRPFAAAGSAAEFLARARQHGFFVERRRAEVTPAWKQLIPYCVVATDEGVLLMKRRAKGGEARLHGKLSIGVGGHINPIDGVDSDEDLVARAAQRELEEELVIPDAPEPRLSGLINDDSNPVGAVHLGLVFCVNPPGRVTIREQDVLEGRMVLPEELRRIAHDPRGESLETWSSLLVPHLGVLALVDRSTKPTATIKTAARPIART